MQRCPLCLKEVKTIHKNFCQCYYCKTIFFLDAQSLNYEVDYFNNEYQSQYGKTYFEDHENISAKAKQRIALTTKYCTLTEPMRILEIGSAAGFFLEQAKEKWAASNIQGWEISKTMCEFSQKRGNQVICGNYFDLFREWKRKKQAAFDLVFAFYSIEHFDDQNAFWSSVSQLVKRNGYLILSIPSYYGPMFYFHKKKWFSSHPQDHFADYSPYSLKEVGKIFSFDLAHVSPDAVHPERIIPFAPNLLKKRVAAWQKKINFADTIFAILQRKGGTEV